MMTPFGPAPSPLPRACALAVLAGLSLASPALAQNATKPKPLDLIRPQQWVDAWNDELLDLLRVLTITSRRAPEHAALLDAICDGELVGADDLPQPAPGQERVPATKPRGQSQGTLL